MKQKASESEVVFSPGGSKILILDSVILRKTFILFVVP